MSSSAIKTAHPFASLVIFMCNAIYSRKCGSRHFPEDKNHNNRYKDCRAFNLTEYAKLLLPKPNQFVGYFFKSLFKGRIIVPGYRFYEGRIMVHGIHY